jgi:hypothetical protein
MESIQDALRAWRAAERRLREFDGDVPFEVHQELVEAKRRYHELATPHQSSAMREPEQHHAAVGRSPEGPGRD